MSSIPIDFLESTSNKQWNAQYRKPDVFIFQHLSNFDRLHDQILELGVREKETKWNYLVTAASYREKLGKIFWSQHQISNEMHKTENQTPSSSNIYQILIDCVIKY